MTNRETFDRLQAIQHDTPYTFDATISDIQGTLGVMTSGFITSPVIKTLMKEFDGFYLNSKGLVFYD